MRNFLSIGKEPGTGAASAVFEMNAVDMIVGDVTRENAESEILLLDADMGIMQHAFDAVVKFDEATQGEALTAESAIASQNAYGELVGDLGLSSEDLDAIGARQTDSLTKENAEQYPESEHDLTHESAEKIKASLKAHWDELVKRVMAFVKKYGSQAAATLLNVGGKAEALKQELTENYTDTVSKDAKRDDDSIKTRAAGYAKINKDALLDIISTNNSIDTLGEMEKALKSDIAAKDSVGVTEFFKLESKGTKINTKLFTEKGKVLVLDASGQKPSAIVIETDATGSKAKIVTAETDVSKVTVDDISRSDLITVLDAIIDASKDQKDLVKLTNSVVKDFESMQDKIVSTNDLIVKQINAVLKVAMNSIFKLAMSPTNGNRAVMQIVALYSKTLEKKSK